eukprot:3941853-Rhodomonas_salina.2
MHPVLGRAFHGMQPVLTLAFHAMGSCELAFLEAKLCLVSVVPPFVLCVSYAMSGTHILDDTARLFSMYCSTRVKSWSRQVSGKIKCENRHYWCKLHRSRGCLHLISERHAPSAEPLECVWYWYMLSFYTSAAVLAS